MYFWHEQEVSGPRLGGGLGRERLLTAVFSTEGFFAPSSKLPSAAMAGSGPGVPGTAPGQAHPRPGDPEWLADKITLGTRVTLVEDTIVLGNVRIGTQSVVHPRASILALGAPIVLGTGCLVEEEAVIVNRWVTSPVRCCLSY